MFMEISRYKGAETHSILTLWRGRQAKGEVAFKFEQYVRPEKEPTMARYDTDAFEGLLDAQRIESHIQQTGMDSDSQEEEGDEDDEVPWPRQSKAADASDDESEGTQRMEPLTSRVSNEGVDGDQHGSEESLPLASRKHKPRTAISPTYDDPPWVAPKKRQVGRAPRAKRNLIESEDDIGQVTPRTHALDVTPNIDSSPTLAGSSPLVQRPTKRQLTGLRAHQRQVLPTPGASQESTPVPPEGGRALRSGTKAVVEAKKQTAAMKAAAAALKSSAKGTTKEGPSTVKGQKKKG